VEAVEERTPIEVERGGRAVVVQRLLEGGGVAPERSRRQVQFLGAPADDRLFAYRVS
jgi:hypothetical protein